MPLPFLRRNRPTLEEQAVIQQSRSRGIRSVLSVSGLIFLALVAFLSTALVLPPLQELQSLRKEKERVQRRLQRAQDEENEAHSRYLWMMDPEYFEQIARDRANQAKEGETVIRRPAVTELPPVRPQPQRRD